MNHFEIPLHIFPQLSTVDALPLYISLPEHTIPSASNSQSNVKYVENKMPLKLEDE
jgi:hypothetical protein